MKAAVHPRINAFLSSSEIPHDWNYPWWKHIIVIHGSWKIPIGWFGQCQAYGLAKSLQRGRSLCLCGPVSLEALWGPVALGNVANQGSTLAMQPPTLSLRTVIAKWRLMIANYAASGSGVLGEWVCRFIWIGVDKNVNSSCSAYHWNAQFVCVFVGGVMNDWECQLWLVPHQTFLSEETVVWSAPCQRLQTLRTLTPSSFPSPLLSKNHGSDGMSFQQMCGTVQTRKQSGRIC